MFYTRGIYIVIELETAVFRSTHALENTHNSISLARYTYTATVRKGAHVRERVLESQRLGKVRVEKLSAIASVISVILTHL
jgi:hypothetical protein